MMVRDAELRVFQSCEPAPVLASPSIPKSSLFGTFPSPPLPLLPLLPLPYPSPTPLLFPPLTSCRKQVTKVTIREFYGQSETTAVVGNTPSTLLKPGSMGLPLPPYDVQVSPSSSSPSSLLFYSVYPVFIVYLYSFFVNFFL